MPLCLAVAALSLAAIDAPVTAVTVYSDRARVTRTANVNVAGSQSFELPFLPGGADPASLRVEASGADVRRVDISPVEPGEIPLDEGRKLLDELEKLDARIRQLSLEKQAHDAELEAIRRLSPTTPPTDPLKPPARLDPGGWTQAATFIADHTGKLQARSRELAEQRDQLSRERERLAEKARLLGATRQGGYRVKALVAGNGPARLSLSYMIGNARWDPTYDIQLVLETGKVQLSFAGLVSQQTGEDWEDAQLTLSTAVPATSTVLPKLATWKIGERDRFIPTPVPEREEPRPPPPAVPPLPVEREEDRIRERLMAAVGQDAKARERNEEAAARQDEDDYAEIDRRRMAEAQRPRKRAPAPAAPPPTPSGPQSMPGMAPPAAAMPPMEYAPAAPEPMPGRAAQQRAQAQGGFSLAPPPGYRPPPLAPDLPASLAGGYDLAYPSLRPETIRSGQGARRVALFSESLPVSVERKLFPALAPEAFLVAELKSPRVLPGGQANLFVGEDPAGTARLKLVAAGQSFTLPLGLDRGLKPIRNVQLVQAERGLISRDDLGEYIVTNELSNPYPVPLQVRILDQWPLSSDKDVEVVLVKTTPQAIRDEVKGSLEWRLTVPPSSKAQVSFVYTVRRPKGWRLYQQ